MTKQQITELIDQLKQKNVQFDKGLTDAEILRAEHKFRIKFPPDLKEFLQAGLPVSKGFCNWRRTLAKVKAAKEMRSWLYWPLDGMLFDIENDDFWFDGWGQRPGSLKDKFAIAKKHFPLYPKLIPIFSHRYIPSEPNEEGNPVFSVHQMDIIYYGFNLATYFSNEFHFALPGIFPIPDKPLKHIEFWGEVVS